MVCDLSAARIRVEESHITTHHADRHCSGPTGAPARSSNDVLMAFWHEADMPTVRPDVRFWG